MLPYFIYANSVADPGFPIGGHGPCRWGCGLPRQLRFENFVCQNKKIGTLRGGHMPGAPPRSANATTSRQSTLNPKLYQNALK